MAECIFCKIVAEELPAYKIYEDDRYLAFLDIFPPTKGYTLVIPKKHYRWVWDVENIGEYFQVCQKIVNHFQKVTGEETVYSMILGEEVPHAHVRLIPSVDQNFTDALTKFIERTRPADMIDHDKAHEIRDEFTMIKDSEPNT